MSSPRFYHPELDVLRLLAFLLIFFDHASGTFNSPHLARLAEASRVGLPLFFVLSSFLITEVLLREHELTGSVHVKKFYVRRMLRIWPLYFLVLTFVYMAGHLTHGHFPFTAYAAYMTFLGSWYSYTHFGSLFGVGVLWSISVEEQFYIVWPVIVKAGASRAVRLSIPPLLLISFVTLCYSTLEGIPADRIWFNSFYQIGYFAVGAALALVLRERVFRPSKFQRSLFFAASGCAFIFTAYLTRWIGLPSMMLTALWVLSFACLLGLTSTFLFLGCFNLKVSENSTLVHLGKISYGLYVFHLLALQTCAVAMRRMHMGGSLRPIAQVISAMILTLLAAQISYRYLEMPFLKLKDRFAFISTRAV